MLPSSKTSTGSIDRHLSRVVQRCEARSVPMIKAHHLFFYIHDPLPRPIRYWESRKASGSGTLIVWCNQLEFDVNIILFLLL